MTEQQYLNTENLLDNLRNQISKSAKKKLSKHISEKLFCKYHHKYETVSGDISPSDQANLDYHIDEISKIIASQVVDNMEITKQINSEPDPLEGYCDRCSETMAKCNCGDISDMHDGLYGVGEDHV